MITQVAPGALGLADDLGDRGRFAFRACRLALEAATDTIWQLYDRLTEFDGQLRPQPK